MNRLFHHASAIHQGQMIGGKPYYQFMEDVRSAATRFDNEKVVYADQKNCYEQAVCIVAALQKHKTVVPLCENYGVTRNLKIKSQINGSKIPRGVAAVLFTSGTNGDPKGVMLSKRALRNNLSAIKAYMGMRRRTILIIRPMIHSAVFTGEFLYALSCGWNILFWEKAFQPTEIAAYGSNQKVDIMGMTPTLLKSFLRLRCQLYTKEIILSGEILTKADALYFATNLPQNKFYSVYGLTEHSPRVSALPYYDFITHAGSVGKLLKGVRAKLVHGELWVKSACVMKGYLGDRQLTKQKMQRGWLKTGDRAKFDRCGNLYILGRCDRMMIRSGMNIYPEEIEQGMRQFEAIEECVAYGICDHRLGLKIVLEYVGDAEEQQVAEYAVLHLPAYLVPNCYRKKQSLDKTISGKLRRK